MLVFLEVEVTFQQNAEIYAIICKSRPYQHGVPPAMRTPFFLKCYNMVNPRKPNNKPTIWG